MNLWQDESSTAMDDVMLERLRPDANLDYIRERLCAEPTMNGDRIECQGERGAGLV